ncbi:MAG TPA: hypothetical protein VML55_03550 [Planctomycetaceae bacterium]|nr:hypothetical protein [Planctomycetaceae bacterium]
MDDRLVEQIVRQVMARLGRSMPDGAAAGAAPGTGAGGTGDDGSGDGPRTRHALVLDEPVVTAETLAQRVNGDRHIAVGRRTVLTPSALDYLRAAGIEWTRDSAGGANPGPAAAATWSAIVSRNTPAVERVLGDARSASRPWRRELAGDVREAAQRAVGCICRGEASGCVVFTQSPEAVACLANRNAAVRAAVAADTAGAAAAVGSMGANALCVSPDGKSYFELRTMLRAFTAAGPPGPPADWSE